MHIHLQNTGNENEHENCAQKFVNIFRISKSRKKLHKDTFIRSSIYKLPGAPNINTVPVHKSFRFLVYRYIR